jgi:catechol 2,3-dioxygenase-like lactoylglutathione lyase family enzyme
MPEIKIEAIDHISLPVAVGEAGKEADTLKKSKEFYGGILGLKEIGRPAALAESIKLGAWYQVGEGRCTLHLIANEDGKSTFRKDKGLSSRDIHFALRIGNFLETLRSLISKGYWLQDHRPEASDEAGDELDLKEMRVSPEGRAGFPQIFIMDPDRNVIELNVGNLLTQEELKLVDEELDKLR